MNLLNLLLILLGIILGVVVGYFVAEIYCIKSNYKLDKLLMILLSKVKKQIISKGKIIRGKRRNQIIREQTESELRERRGELPKTSPTSSKGKFRSKI